MLPTRMGHGLADERPPEAKRPLQLSAADLRSSDENGGVCMDPNPDHPTAGGDEDARKEAEFHVPALQLRRIAQTSGINSIRHETQHFVGCFFFLFLSLVFRFNQSTHVFPSNRRASRNRHAARTAANHRSKVLLFLHCPLTHFRTYRLFWILAMFVCCLMMGYQTWTLIRLYIEKPIVSQ
ncbi:hypothetical protein M3Y99_01384100 [Aphelenchoides fujianensis]|nr:hypothetical protein M3Y99_01384100 [Aphelenchoides fujianensis]